MSVQTALSGLLASRQCNVEPVGQQRACNAIALSGVSAGQLEPSLVTISPAAQSASSEKVEPPGARSQPPLAPQLNPAGQHFPVEQRLPPLGH